MPPYKTFLDMKQKELIENVVVKGNQFIKGFIPSAMLQQLEAILKKNQSLICRNFFEKETYNYGYEKLKDNVNIVCEPHIQLSLTQFKIQFTFWMQLNENENNAYNNHYGLYGLSNDVILEYIHNDKRFSQIIDNANRTYCYNLYPDSSITYNDNVIKRLKEYPGSVENILTVELSYNYKDFYNDFKHTFRLDEETEALNMLIQWHGLNSLCIDKFYCDDYGDLECTFAIPLYKEYIRAKHRYNGDYQERWNNSTSIAKNWKQLGDTDMNKIYSPVWEIYTTNPIDLVYSHQKNDNGITSAIAMENKAELTGLFSLTDNEFSDIWAHCVDSNLQAFFERVNEDFIRDKEQISC